MSVLVYGSSIFPVDTISCARLTLNPYSPYDILDLPVSATEAEIKRQYRKKSLLIHPDKFKHEQGMEVSGCELRWRLG